MHPHSIAICPHTHAEVVASVGKTDKHLTTRMMMISRLSTGPPNESCCFTLSLHSFHPSWTDEYGRLSRQIRCGWRLGRPQSDGDCIFPGSRLRSASAARHPCADTLIWITLILMLCADRHSTVPYPSKPLIVCLLHRSPPAACSRPMGIAWLGLVSFNSLHDVGGKQGGG
jgi:hypothetical protein